MKPRGDYAPSFEGRNAAQAMKSLLAILLLAGPAHAASPTIDNERMVRVLVEIEGGKWTDFGGAAHMGFSAWSQHSAHAYQLSTHREYAMPEYLRHIEWTVKWLKVYGVPPTPKNVALVWRFGMDGAKRRAWRGDYGDRSAALYADTSFQ